MTVVEKVCSHFIKLLSSEVHVTLEKKEQEEQSCGQLGEELFRVKLVVLRSWNNRKLHGQVYHIKMNQVASFCMCTIKKGYLSKPLTTNNIKSNLFKEDIKVYLCMFWKLCINLEKVSY